ncbi:MAG TPA: methylthioribulose 1-phosphate dehydratase [Steroidobacteraceae bacterium]
MSLDEAVEAIIASGQRLDARGLAPATSGNYSIRLGNGRIAVTVSGRHKGRLGRDDVMLVDTDGVALEGKKPSAETALHTVIYRLHPQVNAVLHVHSVPVVALTRHLPGASEVVLEGYEMLKAFPGITTHEVTVAIPIFENSQDIAALAREIAEDTSRRLRSGKTQAPTYLIRGHGAYGWGKNMEEAERVIEGLEHLLSCEIEALRLRAGVQT